MLWHKWELSRALPFLIQPYEQQAYFYRYMEALKQDPDIILGGRSYDPAPFAAFCLSRGVVPGVAWHMGKIVSRDKINLFQNPASLLKVRVDGMWRYLCNA